MSKIQREAYLLGVGHYAPSQDFGETMAGAAQQAFIEFPDKSYKNVREMLVECLKDNEFDGLYEPGCECGCFIDDLAPCDRLCESCIPGYRVKCIDEYTGKEIDGVGPSVLREGKIVPREVDNGR